MSQEAVHNTTPERVLKSPAAETAIDGGLTEVVYHGSPRSFNDFDTDVMRQVRSSPDYSTGNETEGIYFTDSKDVANGYAAFKRGIKTPEGEGHIRMARLHFEHPYVTSDYADLLRASKQKGIDALRAAGYDGFIYEARTSDNQLINREYIAFNKDQIFPPWTTSSGQV